MLSQVPNLTHLHTFHISRPFYADNGFFSFLTRCSSLKSLWLVCTDMEKIQTHFSELGRLRLDEAHIFLRTPNSRSEDSISASGRKELFPLQDLLSGESVRSLRSLGIFVLLPFKLRRDHTEQDYLRLIDIVKADSVFASLETLHLHNVSISDVWMQAQTTAFPSLHIFSNSIREALNYGPERPLYEMMPDLRRLSLANLTEHERILSHTLRLEYLTINYFVDFNAFPMLCRNLADYGPASRLSVLVLKLCPLHFLPENAVSDAAHGLHILLSATPRLEKFCLSESRIRYPLKRWRDCIDAYIHAFSGKLTLLRVKNYRTSLTVPFLQYPIISCAPLETAVMGCISVSRGVARHELYYRPLSF